ncbi:RNA-directed DNA polymerase, eukaryota [Tanacetum coccineum]
MIFKVDFEKAYDSVRWDYLDDVLKRFGFGEKWCGWIQNCLLSSKGSVIVNGSPSKEFQFHRGLKQGDPLSPFLFLLIMESLHISMQRVVDADLFRGIQVGSSLQVSHLFYADDAVFMDIVKEVQHIQRQRTDLMGFIHRKMGNGVDIRFWEDKWRGDNTFQSDFPRMYALETQKNISVALKLSHDDLLCSFRRAPRAGAEELQYIQLVKIMEGITLFDSKDRWRWSLEGCGEFTVASVRNLLDANSLPVVSSKTRWIKAVPIKVNIHAWKVKLDILPTRLNISKRGMDIESILCPLCEKNVESSSHILFTCPISKEIFLKVLLWWEIDVVMVSSYDEWLEWLLSIRLHS